MMDDDVRSHARSFGPIADRYDRGRPSFPDEAVRWLVGTEPATVLELGAGTGKLTEVLARLGHDVHATEPDPGMLKVLKRRLPDVPTSESGAEEIPLPDRSVDVVVAAQAFHWFDHDVALPEIARVLRPGGHLALTWNQRDTRIPWVRKLGRILEGQPGSTTGTTTWTDPLVQCDLFGFVDEKTFHFWQDVNRETILDLVASRSYVAMQDEEAREATLAQVLALYDDYGRGMDGMQLPYDCECFRAQVLDRPDAPGDPDEDDAADGAEAPVEGAASPRRVSDGGDPDVLLIDFR